MTKFTKKMMPLAEIKANQQNPRIISESKLKKLINSLLVFPKMMSLRPITVDSDCFVLGGNMRQTALGRIAQMKPSELQERIETLTEYKQMTDEDQKETLRFWSKFLRRPMIEVQVADGLTIDEKNQFIIKDNVSYGDWDYDELQAWDETLLEDWGLDMQMPDFGEGSGGFQENDSNNDEQKNITETEKLSKVEFVDAYYQPKHIPDINLRDCINTDLFEKKVAFVETLDLSDEQKAVMKMLAYRFIRIDFEAVANYYAFNASDEEKRAIERLRCVLVDGSLDGFIGDSLLRVYEHFDEKYENTENEDEDEENG